MGMLFQRSALFDSLTVWENITFRLRQNSRISGDEAIEVAHAKLAAVGLEPTPPCSIRWNSPAACRNASG